MSKEYTVVPGRYKGLSAPIADNQPTQAEMDAFMRSLQEEHASFVPFDGPAALGDTVVLDYAGFLGDVQFEGGTDTNASLSLGSGTFIPGFEEQLVGHGPGESVDVRVTFPADYGMAELAGKPALFRCTIHQVQQRQLPPLGDDFAKTFYGAENYEILLSVAQAALTEQKEKTNLQNRQQILMQQVLDNSQVTVSEAWIGVSLQQLFRAFASQLSEQGVTLEDYYQYTGTAEADLMAQLRPQAETGAKLNAVLLTIADAENITVSEEELDGEIGKIADSYGVTLEELKAGMTGENREAIRTGMRTAKAMQLITDCAVPD